MNPEKFKFSDRPGTQHATYSMQQHKKNDRTQLATTSPSTNQQGSKQQMKASSLLVLTNTQ